MTYYSSFILLPQLPSRIACCILHSCPKSNLGVWLQLFFFIDMFIVHSTQWRLIRVDRIYYNYNNMVPNALPLLFPLQVTKFMTGKENALSPL